MPDQAALNDFYKQHFGYDFGALAPERVKAATELIRKLRMAQVPFYTQKNGTIGNPERAAIEAAGGIDPKEAEAMAVFAAWQRGAMPEQLDRDRLIKGGVPPEEADRAIGERTERWKQDTRREFDVFARKDQETPVTGTKKQGAEGEAKPAEEAAPPAVDVAETKEHRAKGIREGNRIRVVRS